MSNVRLFVGYLVRGKSVRDTPSGRISVHHFPRWPVRVRFHMDRWHARRWRSWVSMHGIESGSVDGWDTRDGSARTRPQPVYTTILRIGPLLIAFGPDWRR